MKQTINLSQFRDEFNAIRPNNFTYEGQEIIFDYLEECDEDMELDVIAICCGFEEMTHQEIADAYSIEVGEDEELDEEVLTYLNRHTSVIGETSDTVVFVSF